MKRAEQLYFKIREGLLSGELGKNGDRFMTVRDFAKEYTCSLHCALDVFNMLLNSRILRRAGKHCYITTGRCPSESAYSKVLSDSRQILFGVLLHENGNPFFGSLIDHLQEILQKNGMDLITATSGGDIAREQHILDMFADWKCKGVFNCVAIQREQQHYFEYYPLPIVTLAEDSGLLSIDAVMVDNYAAGKQVAKHLISTGCKSFAYITLDNYVESDMRLKGYRQYLSSKQIDLNAHNIGIVSDVNDDLRTRELTHFIRKLLDDTAASGDNLPLGIFCVHDLLAVEVMRIIKHTTPKKQKKVRIPEDVKIVGFDDLPLASLVSIPLTTVSYPYSAMAKKAFDVMMDHLQNPNHEPKRYEIQSSLVIRESSEIK